jgi:glycosyltransferase involved in cell wall biosynthesis
MSIDKKIKITFVLNNFIMGGVQRQLTFLLSHFDYRKLEISLVTLFDSSEYNILYNDLPANIIVYKLNFASFFDIISWIKLIKIILNIKPDIVISSLFFSNTVVRVLKPFLGYRVITREHNTYIDKKRIHIFLDKILSVLSYKIIAVSKTVAEFTSKQENIPLGKFEVIYNGVDIDGIENIKKRMPSKKIMKLNLGFQSSDKLIINVARLAEQKNHELLIKSFAKFSDNFSNYKLIILGEGGLRNKLQEIVEKLNKKDKIYLLGNKENIFDYYYISEFFVSTSTIEGLSNAYLEAMAFGLPLISTKTAGTDEILIDGENGFFINESSCTAVAKTIEKMAHNRDLLKNKSLKILETFDIRKTASKYEKLFFSGKTIECIGMQGSGKTTATEYMNKNLLFSAIIDSAHWKSNWKKYSIKFIISHKLLFLWFLYTALHESFFIRCPFLFFHKIYILLVTGARWSYLHKHYPIEIRIIDEGFMQLILSLYEHYIDKNNMKYIVKKFPIADVVLYFETKNSSDDIGKISKERMSFGKEYVLEWKKVFRHNLSILKEILEEQENDVVNINLNQDDLSVAMEGLKIYNN